MKVWPILYRRTSTGAIQQWQVIVQGNEIITEYGQVGGALQRTGKKAEAKNIGKANETTPEEQALLEAQSMFDKRAELKYSTDIASAQVADPILPMLAHDFEKHKHKINWKEGVLVQPKLDGCRALAYRDDSGHIVLMSRQGKPWTVLPHIIKALEPLIPAGSTDVLDGELYIHGVSFQTVTRLVKKQRPESARITYQVYDVITDHATTQAERNAYLEQLFEDYDYPLNQWDEQEVWNVASHYVYQEADVYKLQSRFVEVGYEGAIVRLPHAKYRMNHRSNELLKVKSFLEEDFKIVFYRCGRGKFEDRVIFRCITTEGKEFDVVPKGSMEEKAEMFNRAESYIGKMLSVKFFEYSEDGIPRFPVGLGVKEDR